MKELMFFMGVYCLLNPEKSMSLTNKHFFPTSFPASSRFQEFLVVVSSLLRNLVFPCWMHLVLCFFFLSPAVGFLPLISTADGFEAAFQRIVFESAGQPIKCKVCAHFYREGVAGEGVGEIDPLQSCLIFYLSNSQGSNIRGYLRNPSISPI